MCCLLSITACTSRTSSPGDSMLYVSMSDPGNALDGVTSILLTVSAVSIHNQDSDAWIELTTTEQTLDLMQLKVQETKELLTAANLPDGKYNQVRLDISKVLVTSNGEAQEAKLPSNTLKINIDLQMANSTAVLNFDVMANASLHKTGNGKIIMAPVINVETYKDADVEKTGKNIEVKTQKAKTTEEIGMDEKGNVGKGVKINPDTELEIDTSGKVQKKSATIPPTGTTATHPGTGKALFTIKDKNNKTDNETADDNTTDDDTHGKPITTTTGLNVTELNVTITNLQIHAADNDSWITVTNESKTFNLLELQDTEALLGEAELAAGKYTQIRMDVETATGVIDGKKVQLTVPSKTLKLVGVLNIEANTTSLATIDFLVEKSVHKAGMKYLLKPVIRLTTKTGITVKEKTRDNNMEKIRYDGGKVKEDIEIDTATA